MSDLNKKPAQVKAVKIDNTKLLPSVLATEPNKKMLGSTLDVMTSKGQLLPFKETHGIRTAARTENNFFLEEADPVRREAMSNIAIIARSDTFDFKAKASYLDIENYFSIKGLPLKDGVQLDENILTADLPINYRCLIDYQLYYWLEWDLPAIRLHADPKEDGSKKYSVATDIIGQPYIRVLDDLTGKELEFSTGLFVYFTGAQDAEYLSTDPDQPKIYYVAGVSEAITLRAVSEFDERIPRGYMKKRPWDKWEPYEDPPAIYWDSERWDGSKLMPGAPEYVTMARFARDNNPWSVLDHWYHISTIRIVSEFLEIPIEKIARPEFQARRPIISFYRNIKLYNWPSRDIGDIKSLLPGSINDFIGRRNIKDPGNYRIKDADRVVFAKTPGVWVASGVGAGITFTKVQDSREGDGALITSISDRLFYRVHFKNGEWILAQNKVESNQTPLFEFYRSNGENLETRVNTSYRGGVILGFKEGPTYDAVLDKNISVSNIDFDIVNENNPSVISANQIRFTTDIDRAFVEFNENLVADTEIQEPWGYKIGNRINPFYVRRQGIDATPAMQDMLYEEVDGSWESPIVPPANGFREVHLYPNGDDVDIYYNLDGLGTFPFTTKKGVSTTEKLLPLISGTYFRIVCHDLKYPVYFSKQGAENNITTDEEMSSFEITNNGISNGVIEINLNDTYNDGTEDVTNVIALDKTRLVWHYNSIPRVAIVKPIEKWRFITSAYYLDKTTPVYNDYDFNVESYTPPKYIQKVVGTELLSRKIKTGDKLGFESYVKINDNGSGLVKTAPLSLTDNPLNSALDTINYYSLYQHAVTAASSNPNAREMIDPSLDTYLAPQQLNGGTLIKHNRPLARAALMATALPFDFSEIVVKQGKHYDVFVTRLTNELQVVINNFNYESYSKLDLLDLALQQIYLNQKDNESFWYHSNMVGWGDNREEMVTTVPGNLTISLVGVLDVIPHAAGKEKVLHITHNGRILTRGVDYDLQSDLPGYYTKAVFKSSLVNEPVTLRQWNSDFVSRVPASLAKIGLAPCYIPEIYKDTSYNTDTYFLIRHDGTRYYLEAGVTQLDDLTLYPADLLDQLLYEYEKAVWSSIAYAVESNSQETLYKTLPGAFRTTRYQHNEVLELVNNEMYAWMQDNSIFVLNNNAFDPGNPFTFRYQLGSGDEADTVYGSWRAIYKYLYDTDRPHTHPWEMLGFTVKPKWWDSFYSWTDPDKRAALERALRQGNVAMPPGYACKPWLARNNSYDEVQEFPVDANGNLLAPTQLDWLNAQLSYDGQDWAPGDLSPYEVVFRSTQRGLGAVVKSMYLCNPVEYVNLNWMPGESHINEWGQRVNSTTNFWMTPALEHDYHRKTLDDGSINFNAGIESLYGEFCALTNKDFVATVVEIFANTIINKEFLLGGFTNKNNVRIQSNSAPNQTKSLFVAEENYHVRTLHHYPEREDFYSAMRIIWDGESWNVFGFNNEKTSFNYFEPADISPVVAVTVGDFLVKEKTTYDKTVIKTLRYGTSFDNRQALYDFILGYGKYLESRGFVFDDVELGDIRNWQLSAKQFIFWSNDPLDAGNYIDLNPAANGIKMELQKGQLYNLLGSDLNVGQVVDRFGKPMFSKDLLVNRAEKPFVIKPRDANRPIYGVKLVFVTYESVLHLDSTSVFNDVYFLPEQATTKRSFTLGGKKSQDWDGSYWVPGYALFNMELIPNFETMSEVGRNLLDIENVLNDTEILAASRSQFGLNRNPELRQLFLLEESETLFKTATTFDKGTRKVFNSLEPLTHKDGTSVTAYEEYMVRVGEFGNTKNTDYFEFEVKKSDFKKDPQIIKFEDDGDTSNRKVYILDKSNRWVFRPYGKTLRFNTFERTYSQLKTTGPIINGDTDYILENVESLPNMYSEFEPLWIIPAFSETEKYKKGDQVRNNGKLYVATTTVSPNTWSNNQEFFTVIDEPFLPNFYVKQYNQPNPTLTDEQNSKFTPATWQVLQVMDPELGINECCPGLVDTDLARINTNKDHGLVAGDMVMIVNADNGASSVNGIWKVHSTETETIKGVTKYYFYLDTNIPGTIKTGKVFTFKPVRFKTTADLEQATEANGYYWKKKFNPKENILDGAGVVPPDTTSGYSSVAPIAIVDDGTGTTTGEYTYDFGNYKVYQLEGNDKKVVKEESKPVNPDNIEHLIIYDYEKNVTLAKVELFDPKKGKLPSVFTSEIDFINRVDPAKYTRTTDEFKTVYQSTGWFDLEVGRRWWDTSTIQFQDYESGSDYDRARLWGSTVDGALPEIYEWTRSSVPPSKWDSLVEQGGSVFGVKASGKVYCDESSGSKKYYWTEETDYKSGKAYTVYYFWVKNKNSIPVESKAIRTYSTAQLSNLLLNPSSAGLAWWAPISYNAITLKGVENLVSESGTVVQIKFKQKGEQKHQQWIFVSEGNPLFIVPEWMHIRLRDSLSTFAKYQRKTVEGFEFYESKRVPDIINLHRYNRLGNDIRPYHQSWFNNVLEARRTFIKRVNQLLLNMDLVASIEGWDDLIGQTQFMWGDQEINLTKMWYYTDYISTKYDSRKSIVKTVESQGDLIDLDVKIGDYVKVVTGKAVYEKLVDGGWDVVKRTKGTIQFIDDLYDKKSLGGWDILPWDNTPWDFDLNAQVSVIVDALRHNIFVRQYRVNYSYMTCTMLRYVLSEQLNVDWLTKASTILPFNTIGQTFTTETELQRDNIAALNSFYNSVKAFRDKSRDGSVTKSLTEDVNMGIEEFPVMKITMKYERTGFGSPETIDTTVSGLNFVPVGWDNTAWDDTEIVPEMGWDTLNAQTYWDYKIQKIYQGYKGVPADQYQVLLQGSTKSKYYHTPHQEEACEARITDNLVIDVIQKNVKVREHYHKNMMSAMILDSRNQQIIDPVTPETTLIKLSDMRAIPDANPENPGAIWIGNEKIIYTVKEDQGISGLIRGAFGTPMYDHGIGEPVYVESATTLLHGYLPLQDLNNVGPFYNDLGVQLELSENPAAKMLMRYISS